MQFDGGDALQDVVSVKITTSTGSYLNTMFTGDSAGAPGVRTNNWNNIFVINGNSQAFLYQLFRDDQQCRCGEHRQRFASGGLLWWCRIGRLFQPDIADDRDE